MLQASIALIALLLPQGGVPVGRGAVAGRILQEDGTPAVGVRVAAVASDNAGTDAMMIVAQTQSDVDGRYRLEDLPAGRYFIAAGLLRALTYFPGVATSATAQAITITVSSSLEDRDFRLLNQPAPLLSTRVLPSPEARTVSGRFVVEGGGPLPRNVILKHSPGGASFAAGFIATPLIADATGVFKATFTGANGGRIVLQTTEPSAYVVGSVMFGADDASTRRATVITGRELVVTFKSTGVKVTGRITGGTSPLVDGRKVLLVGTTSVPGTFPMTVSRETVIGTGGQFTFSDVFRGAYEIRVAGADSPVTRIDVTDADVVNVSVTSPAVAMHERTSSETR